MVEQTLKDKEGPKHPSEDLVWVLEQAEIEISSLRKANREMKIRLDTFDDCIALLISRPPSQGVGYQEDILGHVRKQKEVVRNKMYNDQIRNIEMQGAKDGTKTNNR